MEWCLGLLVIRNPEHSKFLLPVIQGDEDGLQGASGIDARFLKLSPALTISPIMTKFSQ